MWTADAQDWPPKDPRALPWLWVTFLVRTNNNRKSPQHPNPYYCIIVSWLLSNQDQSHWNMLCVLRSMINARNFVWLLYILTIIFFSRQCVGPITSSAFSKRMLNECWADQSHMVGRKRWKLSCDNSEATRTKRGSRHSHKAALTCWKFGRVLRLNLHPTRN